MRFGVLFPGKAFPSFRILEIISSIEDEFLVQLDMATLDAKQITILGPLSPSVAENAKPN